MTGGAATDPALVVTDSMIAIDHQLTHLPVKSALQLIEFCRRRLDASEARILADRYEAGADDRDIEDSIRDGQTSKAEAKKRAKRAKATNANPDIADKLADGTLSTEQADIIAEAADDTDGEAACDEKLIEDIASTTPEQGKKKARDYVNKRTSPDDVQKRFDKQNRQRGVYRHRLNNGNDALTIHGPSEYIDEMEGAMKAQSNEEYEADGGRDLPRHKHTRTHDQRNFDAARKLLTNNGASSSSDRPGSKKRRHATVFVTATVDQLSGIDTSPITSIDGKPLPQSFVDEIAGDAAFIAQLFSTDGELLWQGRQVRLATPAQINGLISRDRGCAECGAHPSKCVAHHRLPYEARVKGETNIPDLVLLCTDCHVRLHRAKRTMFYDIESKSWKTRPATPDEIPPEYQGNVKPDAPPGKYRAARNTPPRKRVSTKPNFAERQRQPSLGPPPGRDDPPSTPTDSSTPSASDQPLPFG